jgi:hypothetical protein
MRAGTVPPCFYGLVALVNPEIYMSGRRKPGIKMDARTVKKRLEEMTACGILEPTGTFEDGGGPEYRISGDMHMAFCRKYLTWKGKAGSQRRLEEALIVAMGRVAREKYPEMNGWKFSGMITRFYPIAKVMIDDSGVAGELDRLMEKNAMNGRKAGA